LINSGSRVGGVMVGHGQKLQSWREAHPPRTVGWQASCDCPQHDPVPSVVLDPFGGAGTTGVVAQQLGRRSVLIELNPDYADIIRQRVQ
jgi:adenine-specific DNA methylase